MGKHRADSYLSQVGQAPAEITNGRICDALDSLGFSVLERFDRIVVPHPAYIATVWVSYEKPLMLVVDCTERIPIDFGHSADLARFLNSWNHDRVGPTASLCLNDAGDINVRLRAGVCIRHGLTDEQLLEELCDAFEHMSAFSTQLRIRFLPVEFDVPLAPTLLRAQDMEALLGRHPSSRHLPRDGEHEVSFVPEMYAGHTPCADERETYTQTVGMAQLEDVFEVLDFTYALTPEDVLVTGVNGVAFAVCIDDVDYARITGMWDAGEKADFLALWLMCNSINEKSEGVCAYIQESATSLHVHVETTSLITQGLSVNQLNNFVVTSLVSILSSIDAVSAQCNGSSAVRWPGSDA
ncbi:YbjN domain-containing protein [Corynebacterium mayonis]|uniref:YbjN domain-containing protein n=1 Tax=Corynebacterium mayonis TaxID=3062461 RepID=UPI00314084FC